MVATLRDLRTMGTLDPDALGTRAEPCHVLIDLGALVEARTCVATLVQRESASPTLSWAQIRLAMIDRDAPAALAFLAQMQPVPEEARASILLSTGQAAEALAIYRKLRPGLFAQPTPQVYPGQASDAAEIGIALIETGAKPQGRALLEAAIMAIADRPYAAVIAGRGWLDVYAYVYLDQPDRAFTALQSAVSSGYFLGLAELDTDPLLADLRADSRYMKILAPARARAATQVNAARAAGLL